MVKAELGEDGSAPRKRIRCKQEPPNSYTSVKVKKEPQDPPSGKQDVSEDEQEDSEDEQETGTFTIGERVQRRDNGKEWGFGYVTLLKPLEVTAKDDPEANGYQWDQIRHIPREGSSSTMKRPAAQVRGRGRPQKLGRMQKASAMGHSSVLEKLFGRPLKSVTASSSSAGCQAPPPPGECVVIDDSQRLPVSSEDTECRVILSLDSSKASPSVAEASTDVPPATAAVDEGMDVE